MCPPSAPRDNSAEIARQQEQARQRRINRGTRAIDNNFAQFDDGFFQGVGDNFSNFHTRGLNEQFGDAQEKLTFNLARSGNLDSSAGAKAFGKLNDRFADRQAEIASGGRDAILDARGNVENSRSQLINQLGQSANPTAAAKQSVNQAAQLARPQTLSPVTGLFADLINFGNAGIIAEQEGGRGFGLGIFDQNKNGKGSANITP